MPAGGDAPCQPVAGQGEDLWWGRDGGAIVHGAAIPKLTVRPLVDIMRTSSCAGKKIGWRPQGGRHRSQQVRSVEAREGHVMLR